MSSPSTYAVQRLSRGRSRSATEQQSTKQPLDVADEAAVEPADEADNRKQDEQDGNNADNEGMRDASSDESREVSGDTEHTDKPFASEAATQGRNARRLFRMPPTSVEPSMRFRSWRYSPSLPLDELLSRLPPQTRKFFSRLDKEFERVESFYEEQETKAWARYQELRDQWEELERHKREYNVSQRALSRCSKIERATDHLSQAQHDGATGQRLPARMHGMPHLRQRNLARRVLQGQAHAIHVPGYGAEAAAAHRHLEDYKAARSKIKLACMPRFPHCTGKHLTLRCSVRVLQVARAAQAVPHPQQDRLCQGALDTFRTAPNTADTLAEGTQEDGEDMPRPVLRHIRRQD